MLDGELDSIDRINLIKVAFDGFLSISTCFDAETQEQMRAVAIALYSGNEVCSLTLSSHC